MSTKEALMHEIENAPESLLAEALDFLRNKAAGEAKRESTLDKAIGLLRTSAPAPSDEQVRQWLEEERTRKFA